MPLTATMNEIEKAKREARLNTIAKILAGIIKVVVAVVIVFVTFMLMAASIAMSMGSGRSDR